MTEPTERATEIVVTVNGAEPDLNRGKLAVTTHLVTHLTQRVHGTWIADSSGGAVWHFTVVPRQVQILQDDLKSVWAGEPATVTWLAIGRREGIG